jgi:uncharacterized protein with LGFP repeats
VRFRNRLVRVLLTVATSGAVSSVPAVAQATYDPIAIAYQQSGGAAGPLGGARSAEDCTLPGQGCSETFEHGTFYWMASVGAHYVLTTGGISSFWNGAGGVTGTYGWPVSDTECDASSSVCGQEFQLADVSWSTAAGVHAIPDKLRSRWRESGALGPVGPATDDATCTNTGCGQDFTGGSIYADWQLPPYLVQAPLLASWNARGRLTATLFPMGEQTCGLAAGGCGQHFELGGLYQSPATRTAEVPRNLEDGWARAGGAAGWLGYPVSEARCPEGVHGCLQNFQGGAVAAGASYQTAYAVGGAIGAYWAQTGWEHGPLGYPASDIRCGARGGGCLQNFNYAGVAWSPASGAHRVSGDQGWKWGLLGYENGWLGYPVTDARCGAPEGGCLQGFQGGAMVTTSWYGTHATGGAIGAYWGGQGWENGRLGYPAGDIRCGAAQGGCLQSFADGAVTWTPALGAHAVSGTIGSHWGNTGWENGPLGYPVADATCNTSGCVQRFQGGTIRSNYYGIAWTQ